MNETTEKMTCNVLQSIDKALVAKRFAHARNTYGHEARVQQQVAEKMLRLLLEHACTAAAMPNGFSDMQKPYGHTPNTFSDAQSPYGTPSPFRHIVEFGCGTGCYSRLLLHSLQPETLLLNDLCPEMEECVRELCIPNECPPPRHACGSPPTRVRFLPCDAEALDFPQGTDLITSCSTLQWFADAKRFFARCHRFLSDGGTLAFSTFGRKNMHEIRTLTGNGLEYLPLESLKALLAPRFEVLYAEEEIVSLPFGTPLEVLQHLKQTGVTGTEKRVWTRGRLQSFCNEYIRMCGNADHSVSLTYHPIYIIARKKE